MPQSKFSWALWLVCHFPSSHCHFICLWDGFSKNFWNDTSTLNALPWHASAGNWPIFSSLTRSKALYIVDLMFRLFATISHGSLECRGPRCLQSIFLGALRFGRYHHEWHEISRYISDITDGIMKMVFTLSTFHWFYGYSLFSDCRQSAVSHIFLLSSRSSSRVLKQDAADISCALWDVFIRIFRGWCLKDFMCYYYYIILWYIHWNA